MTSEKKTGDDFLWNVPQGDNGFQNFEGLSPKSNNADQPTALIKHDGRFSSCS